VKNKGSVLFLSILVILFVTTITISIIYVTQKESTFQVYSQLSENALYLAEAGADYMIHILRNDTDPDDITDHALGDGTFSVTVESLGNNQYKIISTGYIPNSTNPRAKRRIQVTVSRDQEAFEYIALVQDEAKLNWHGTERPQIYGDIHSNAVDGEKNSVKLLAADIHAYGDKNGNVTSVGEVVLQDASTVEGNIDASKLDAKGGSTYGSYSGEAADPVSFPAIDYDFFKNIASTVIYTQDGFDTVVNDSWDGSQYYLNGVYYIEDFSGGKGGGTLYLDTDKGSPYTHGQGTVTVLGTIITENKFVIQDVDAYYHNANYSSGHYYPAIVARGGIDISGAIGEQDSPDGPVTITGLLYTEEGTIYSKCRDPGNRVYIYGSETAYKIHNDNYFTLKYDPNVKYLSGVQGGEISILEWKELPE